MSDVESRVAEIIVAILGMPHDEIKSTSRFREDLEADSLEVIDMIMSVEDGFGIVVPDEKAGILLTVSDLVAHIKAAQSA